MSQNLLDLVQNYFTSDTVRQTSAALGESESSVGTALRSVVPLALGGLLAHAQQPGGAANLLGMAQQAHSSGLLGNLSGLLGGLGNTPATTPTADGGLLSRGGDLLRSVMGSGYTPAVAAVGQQAGVGSSTVSSLLSMAVPVVLGLLGRHASQNNLDANGLGSYLGEQRGSITSALGNLPGGLSPMLSGLGLGTAATNTAGQVGSTVAAAANRTGDAVRNTTRDVETAVASPNRWPWILLALAALAAVLYFVRSRNQTPEAPAATTMPADTARTVAAAPAAAPTGRYDEKTGNYVYDTGAATTVKLPDGTVLNVGGSSTEARLFNFLNDNGQTVSTDKTQGWISLDRVYFNTGKATLTNESLVQLQNLAAILKAFPNAAIKLGGYTDNTGVADKNVLLSADRANAARMTVVAHGIAPGRVMAEGYGQEHPLTSNDTPAGRAQNRRVDVRVTKK
ncbi:hypothetical protein A0257_13050 [Hymenobacter psoromatis]|nr:hypothetical protein A0257_13050 [Hymenobacter psoromatis]